MDADYACLMSNEEERKIIEAFVLYDNECNGFMEAKDLKFAMHAVGFDEDDERIKANIKEYSENGRISFQRFRLIMCNKFAECHPKHETSKEFNSVGDEGSEDSLFNRMKTVSRELDKSMVANEYELSSQQEDKIQKAFNLYEDEKCKGFMLATNLRYGMKAAGFIESEEELKNKIDVYSENGLVPLFLFRLIMRQKFAECQPRPHNLPQNCEAHVSFDNDRTRKRLFDNLLNDARELNKSLEEIRNKITLFLKATEISLDLFKEIMRKKFDDCDTPMEYIYEAFRYFENENTRKIALFNIMIIAREYGRTMTDEELQEILAELDNDGQIGQRDLINILQ